MYKKTITYTDFDGVERTEDFYFNFTKAELMDMQFSTDGGLLEVIQNIIKSKNTSELIRLFKDTVVKAYGVKSPDGRKFVKNDEIREDFMATEAFSEIYMELATNSDAAAEFINNIMPAGLATQANELIASGQVDEETKKLLETLNTNK